MTAFLRPASAPTQHRERDSASASPGGPGVMVAAGMAGVGKTALALVAAHRAMNAGWFSGGVFFVDLRGYSPAPSGQVTAAVAAGQLVRAFGVRDADLPRTGEEVLALYRSVLAELARQERPVLIVADNAAVTGQVQPLLSGDACHRLLVTSRHTLTLPARHIDLDVLSANEALDLLCTALSPDDVDMRVAAEPEQARLIAELCGYLPLALQITAALARTEPDRPLADVAADLEDSQHRLHALDSGDQDEHGRPIAVAAAFELSYQHLATVHPEQARLFQILALNPGPEIGLPAAAALANASKSHTRRLLTGLARGHLVTTPALDRWGMHDLLRLYAHEQNTMASSDTEHDLALGRLFTYYLETAYAADRHLRALPGQPVPEHFSGHADALAWFDAERHNLLATANLAYSVGAHDLAATLAPCLCAFLTWRRALDDLLITTTIAYASATQLGDYHREGVALNNLGLALSEVRRFDDALVAHQGAATIFDELDDRHREGGARNNLGLTLTLARRFEDAIVAYRDASTIYRELGDRYGEGTALQNLGNALAEVRRFEEAIAVYLDAISIYREFGDRHSEGGVQDNLGLALRMMSRFEEAVAAHREAATIFVTLGDRHSEGTALTNLGSTLAEMLQFEEAVSVHREAIDIFVELGESHRRAGALGNLGSALQGLSRLEEAVAVHREAAAIFAKLGDSHSRGIALGNLGKDFQQAQRFDEAIDVYREAAAIFAELEDQRSEGETLDSLGGALRIVGRFEEAITTFETVVTIYRELGDRYSEARALTNLGVVLIEVCRFEAAVDASQSAVDIFEVLGNGYYYEIARANLECARRA
ncbi:tetratricopeptide repeat protein [Nonomuraea recticatena]|uniref:tetratricopeptide repeat protein n=1 Tax=Nonomuraea recticatena TaxID=46178 RepID=UPI00361C34D1